MASGQLPEYLRDVYGDATISFVPPVTNYVYAENIPERGINDRDFHWEEVAIELDNVMSGALIDFVMPDMYTVQITPDLGWHDSLSMFGETDDLDFNNPHLSTLGPFSIEGGTLADLSDNSVSVTLSEGDMDSSVIDGYARYLWRAVPWANGNPGLGGLPVAFTYISTEDQLNFTVDAVVKETRRALQQISGTKNPRVTISITNDNNPDVFVDQTPTTWTVSFSIDRPRVKFRINATDSGGTAVGFHDVDIEYESFGQYDRHVWNTFDSFALFASVDRLPGESNAELKDRSIDALQNKGATHYSALIKSINRELGLRRYDNAITLTRFKEDMTSPSEGTLQVFSNHSRLSIQAPSFIVHDEVKRIDKYHKTVTTDHRVSEIVCVKNLRDVEFRSDQYTLTDHVDGNEIEFVEGVTGPIKISYRYWQDVDYDVNTTIGSVVDALNALKSPANVRVVTASLHDRMSGEELSTYLYKTGVTISPSNQSIDIGWSKVGLFAINDEEYKQSFADEGNMFFDSEFYKFVLELKSKTNIEWGFVVADQDFWDAVDADNYGRDSLPTVFDPGISHYVTVVPLRADQISVDFDPWEAFRMGYYYEKHNIRNFGYPREAFRSGVGYKKDCRVGVDIINISSKDSRVNQNPVVYLPDNLLQIDPADLDDFIVNI